MGVVYIGDRGTGKTHLALELANLKSECVTVTNLDYDNLRVQLLDEKSQTKATDEEFQKLIDAELQQNQ